MASVRPSLRRLVALDSCKDRMASKYHMIEYKAEGFWVSYNKSAGAVPVVTVTLQP
jgi:hypothetical protein